MFVERCGDGVNQPDEARGERNPRVAEGVYGLVTPSSKLASDQVGMRVSSQEYDCSHEYTAIFVLHMY